MEPNVVEAIKTVAIVIATLVVNTWAKVWWRRLRASTEHEAHDDDRSDRTNKETIALLREEIKDLRADYKTLHLEHQSCIEMKAQLTERLDHQQRQLEHLKTKLNKLTG